MTSDLEELHEAYADWPEAPKPHFWTVAIYECNRSYGGPEEGGWWYDTGTRVDHPLWHGKTFMFKVPRIYHNEDEAYEYARIVNDWLNAPGGPNNDGRNREINSVNCEGVYAAEVWAGFPPAFYPEVRPHYE